MRYLIGAFLAAVALAGCSSSDDSSNSNSTPSCADVWQPGATLPADYQGCRRADGTLEAAVAITCDGPDLVTYGSISFAFLGGTVHRVSELATDPSYKAALDRCA